MATQSTSQQVIKNALMDFYEESRSYKAWFEYAEPGLLTNRTIRNFLSGYKSDTWPDVVKLTLLYGIVTLQKRTGEGGVLPLGKIRHLVRQLEAARCVEEKLPPIQEKMKDLKGDVEEILEAFENKSPTKRRAENQTKPMAGLPSNAPDAKGMASQKSIYPEWWGDGEDTEKPSTAQRNKKLFRVDDAKREDWLF